MAKPLYFYNIFDWSKFYDYVDISVILTPEEKEGVATRSPDKITFITHRVPYELNALSSMDEPVQELNSFRQSIGHKRIVYVNQFGKGI